MSDIKIKVIGVGGCGGNAVNDMIKNGLEGIDFIAVNTDSQDLRRNEAGEKIQIGQELVGGMGVGGNPDKGKAAAEESEEDLKEQLKDSDLIFLTAGMGGGTGTGATPVIAKYIREVSPKTLIIGVVTRPFKYEGQIRADRAREGLEALKKDYLVDALLVIPNDNIQGVVNENTTAQDAFKKANEVLFHSIRGISDVIRNTGYMNVDFNDVRAILEKSGKAMVGIGKASGQNKNIRAAEAALTSPLLEDQVNKAKGMLVHFMASKQFTLCEMNSAMEYIKEKTDNRVNLKMGWGHDDSLGDELRITIIAANFTKKPLYPHSVSPIASKKDRKEEERNPVFAGQAKARGDININTVEPQQEDDYVPPSKTRKLTKLAGR